MCGISGYIGKFSPEILEKMTAAQIHRGPDGSGHFVDDISGVGLGHRRLSIVDLSEAAAQPMQSSDGRYITVFNGEIYNFKSLFSDLKSKGYSFNQNSDTAILAPLYDAYGPEMLHKLSGIFAFSIWDKKEEKLFCARDHIGTKPFYYAKTPKGLLFASELKSLLFEESLQKELDEQAMFSYLTYLWCPGERTMLKSVKKLLPGHYMTIQNGEMLKEQWYEPPMPQLDRNGKPVYDKNQTPEDLLHLLDEVVDSQMMADVPVGTFLSGGADSSAIAASMAQRDKRPFDAFCIKFDGASMKGEGFSEDVEYAREVCKRYDNIQLHEVMMDETCLNGLPEMVYYLDEPQADPAPLYVREISKIAKEKGIKVLMSGTGGDDIFSGYRRHQAVMALSKTNFIPQPMKRAASSFLAKVGTGNLKRRLMKLRYMLESDIENTLTRSYHYTEDTTLLGLLSEEMKQAYLHRVADHLEEVRDLHSEQHPLNRQLFMEWHGFLPDHNLNYTDKLGMAEGIEIRVPLLDPRMFDFAATLPIDQKIQGNQAKYIFKKSQESRLPHDVLYRSKAGFGAPMRTWLNTTAVDLVQDVLGSKSFIERGIFNTEAVQKLIKDTKENKTDGAYTILSLMVIELWMQQFMDVAIPAKIAA